MKMLSFWRRLLTIRRSVLRGLLARDRVRRRPARVPPREPGDMAVAFADTEPLVTRRDRLTPVDKTLLASTLGSVRR